MTQGECMGYYSDIYKNHQRQDCSDNFPCNAEPNGHGCHRCNALLFDEHEKYQKALEKIYFDAQNNVTIPAVSDADWKRRVKIIVKNALKGEDE
jgi:predicted  nucleic acid-binding Zn-ribbon protein